MTDLCCLLEPSTFGSSLSFPDLSATFSRDLGLSVRIGTFILNSPSEGVALTMTTWWATPPVRLGLSGRISGKIPERPRKRSQSVSWNSLREYGWDSPNPTIQGI